MLFPLMMSTGTLKFFLIRNLSTTCTAKERSSTWFGDEVFRAPEIDSAFSLLPPEMKISGKQAPAWTNAKSVQVHRRLGESLPQHDSQRFRAPGSTLQSVIFDSFATFPILEAGFAPQHRIRS